MWDIHRTLLDVFDFFLRPWHHDGRWRIEIRGIPHLAKNERDMGHPSSFAGRVLGYKAFGVSFFSANRLDVASSHNLNRKSRGSIVEGPAALQTEADPVSLRPQNCV
jgi:hypothetical protein